MSLFGDLEHNLQISVGYYIPYSWVMFNWDICQPKKVYIPLYPIIVPLFTTNIPLSPTKSPLNHPLMSRSCALRQVRLTNNRPSPRARSGACGPSAPRRCTCERITCSLAASQHVSRSHHGDIRNVMGTSRIRKRMEVV